MKSTVNMIMAIDLADNIGKDDGLPWKQSTDLKRFKELTDGHTVVMGRKTFESIGKPLPNRLNLVVTSNPQEMAVKYIDVQGNFSFITLEALKQYIENGFDRNDKIFIIGGRSLWDWGFQSGLVDYVYVTWVHNMNKSLGNVTYNIPNSIVQKIEIVYEMKSEADENNDFKCTYTKFKLL